MKSKTMFVFGVLAVLSVLVSGSAHAQMLVCSPVTFQVALAPSEPANNTIYGEICSRGSIQGKTLQVLLHGGSYDHTYWSMYPNPGQSYVDAITRAGYATLSIDRIGVGWSSHPQNAFAITLHSNAYTVHQIVQKVRSGTLNVPLLGNINSSRIQLVGFSLGSFIATIEASVYADVDAVILTSYSHTLGPAAIASFDLAYPANLEPRFAWLPEGYLTTLPGVREELFFYTPGTTPFMLRIDEWLKQTYTVGELADIFPSLGASFGVHVPTLLVNGDYDLMSCEAPSCTASGSLANEHTNFPQDSCFELSIIPNVGHSINLHTNAGEAYAAMRAWSDRRVGPNINTAPTNPCLP